MVKPAVFKLRGISFGYSASRPIFKGLNLTVEEGEMICVLGANGSGKSTLLKLLCGLKQPTSGTFGAFGQAISAAALRDDRFARDYHRRVGYIFQDSEVQIITTRVWDEIAFGPKQLGLTPDQVSERVNDILNLLGITHLKDRAPGRLSGGEKKKVAVASVLVMNPDVLLLDEPTNGLDPKSQRWLIGLLLELNRAGRTIMTSTHNLALAHAISRRALILSEDHRLIYDGPAQAAIENRELLLAANLIDEYQHTHEGEAHVHLHPHG
ncbi:MAG: energy-coupling factor ABC transporter ATP-binding protein [Solirubrobacterales bacterium]